MNHISKALLKFREEALKRPNLLLALASLPILSLVKNTCSVIYSLTQDLFHSVPNLRKIYGEGSWAVVSGASDGIGKEFCIQLAKSGINVVLIARNKEKTEAVAKEIQKSFPKIETRVLIKDFSKGQEDGFFEDIFEQLKDLDVSILVNNVGTGDIGCFEKSSDKSLKDMINLNCLAIVLLTKTFISNLLARKGKSAIINISSSASHRPIPYMALYSATKVFDDFFSRALSLEYEGKIDVLSLRPSFVRTPLASGSGDSRWHINTDEFVISGLKKLGRYHSAIGHWRHQLRYFLGNAIPISDSKLTKSMKSWATAIEKNKN